MVSLSINAQNCYEGGAGDGYARASLKFTNVGIEVNTIKLNIHPNPIQKGNQLEFTDFQVEDIILLVAVDGRSIELEASKTIHLPSNLASGMYHFVVVRENRRIAKKLIILD